MVRGRLGVALFGCSGTVSSVEPTWSTDAAQRYGEELMTGVRVRVRGDDLPRLAGWWQDPVVEALQMTWVNPPSETAARDLFARWSTNQDTGVGFSIETLPDGGRPSRLIGHLVLFNVSAKNRSRPTRSDWDRLTWVEGSAPTPPDSRCGTAFERWGFTASNSKPWPSTIEPSPPTDEQASFSKGVAETPCSMMAAGTTKCSWLSSTVTRYRRPRPSSNEIRSLNDAGFGVGAAGRPVCPALPRRVVPRALFGGSGQGWVAVAHRSCQAGCHGQSRGRCRTRRCQPDTTVAQSPGPMSQSTIRRRTICLRLRSTAWSR